MQALSFSYQNILKIDNLNGLFALVKLQLDNNIIETIENISHLTNLEWLDLSFNNISRIEGLESLLKLTDLSLFNNRFLSPSPEYLCSSSSSLNSRSSSS